MGRTQKSSPAHPRRPKVHTKLAPNVIKESTVHKKEPVTFVDDQKPKHFAAGM